MNEGLHLDQLRLDDAAEIPVMLPRHRAGDHFLKGPIPMDWLQAAARSPGRALHVAIVLWYHAGVSKNAKIKVNLSRMGAFGLDRHSASRGLKALEEAGLVTVDRAPGRNATVTLLDAPR
jgi:hypothetical protein